MNTSEKQRFQRFALLLDYDGTLALHDTGKLLLEVFAARGWKMLNRLWLEGKLSGRTSLEGQYGLLPADRDALTVFTLEHQVLRSGAQELLAHCRRRSVFVAVVSGGMGFYIHPVLESQNLRLPVFSGEADFSVGSRLRLVYPEGTVVCENVGACKCVHVTRLRSEGYRVAYAGNGASDRCVVTQAEPDLVFACDNLVDYCKIKCIPYVPFNDLYDVLKTLKAWESGVPETQLLGI
jgi:2-hydroxy-3-keto-5-methylthiopentenyl-1-phosphate phosphatase